MMKKLLTISLIIAAVTIGCSKNKAASDAAAPEVAAPAAAAPAAPDAAPVAAAAAPAAPDVAAAPEPAAAPDAAPDVVKPDMDESFGLAKSIRPAKAIEYPSDEENPSFTFHIELKEGGPAFDVVGKGGESCEADCGVFKFTRTDKPNVEPLIVKMDSIEENTHYFEDFNFDGFKDIALFEYAAGVSTMFYTLLIWNPKTEQFDVFRIHTNNDSLELCDENKTMVLNTSAYFGYESPENCLNQYTFDGPKIIQKPWILPAPKPGVVRVSASPSIIDGLEIKTPLITHMEYELREESNGVKAFLVSCGDDRERAFYRDAMLKGMEQKDVNGDGKNDLVFPSKSDPSKKIQATWQEEIRVFVGLDEDEENDEEGAVG